MSQHLWNIRGELVDFQTPKVMAIVNITPDSFACRCTSMDEAGVLSAVALHLNEGADIIDIGGCSTRPDSQPVEAAEEWRRLHIALTAVKNAFPRAIVSVDTFRAELAERAIEEFGVDIINDISGLADPKMLDVIARTRVPYILMHNEPLPTELQETDLMSRVIDFLARRLDLLHEAGVRDVAVDPGFGFGKTIEQNHTILRRLSDLRILDAPILVGLSRKSMFYKPLGITPAEALPATLEAQRVALRAGADILRVHDTAAARDLINNEKTTQL